MKKIFTLALVFCTMTTFAQNEKTVEFNNDTNLYEATYYHDNGLIEQQGTYNTDGKLHGVWTSYDIEGNKIALANYDNGEKVGKWFFWNIDDGLLSEVDYDNAKISNVIEWKNNTEVTLRR